MDGIFLRAKRDNPLFIYLQDILILLALAKSVSYMRRVVTGGHEDYGTMGERESIATRINLKSLSNAETS